MDETRGQGFPLVGVGVRLGNGVGKGCGRALVEVRGERPGGEAVVVGVVDRVGRGGGGQVAQNFVRVDLVWHALDRLGAEFVGVHVAKPVRKLVQDGLELAFVEGFGAPVAFRHDVPCRCGFHSRNVVVQLILFNGCVLLFFARPRTCTSSARGRTSSDLTEKIFVMGQENVFRRITKKGKNGIWVVPTNRKTTRQRRCWLISTT